MRHSSLREKPIHEIPLNVGEDYNGLQMDIMLSNNIG